MGISSWSLFLRNLRKFASAAFTSSSPAWRRCRQLADQGTDGSFVVPTEVRIEGGGSPGGGQQTLRSIGVVPVPGANDAEDQPSPWAIVAVDIGRVDEVDQLSEGQGLIEHSYSCRELVVVLVHHAVLNTAQIGTSADGVDIAGSTRDRNTGNLHLIFEEVGQVLTAQVERVNPAPHFEVVRLQPRREHRVARVELPLVQRGLSAPAPLFTDDPRHLQHIR